MESHAKKNVLTQSPIMSEEKDPDISCEQGSFLLHAFRGSYYLLFFLRKWILLPPRG